MTSYHVNVCRVGHCMSVKDGHFSAACTITLVKGKFNILFDPGSPWDTNLISNFLNDNHLSHEDIHYVVCSHGHVDHIGNLNCFPNATLVVGTEVMRGDQLLPTRISTEKPLIIDDHASLLH